jgi:hypothetical protein
MVLEGIVEDFQLKGVGQSSYHALVDSPFHLHEAEPIMNKFLVLSSIGILFAGPARAEEPKAVSAPEIIKPGDFVSVHVPVETAEAITANSEPTYKALLWLLRKFGQSHGLISMPDGVGNLPANTRGKVLATHDGKAYPLRVSVAEVEIRTEGKNEVLWIPMQYLWDPSKPIHSGEYELPAYVPYNTPYLPRVGQTFFIYDAERTMVSVARNCDDYTLYVKSEISKDYKKIDNMFINSDLLYVQQFTTASATMVQSFQVGKRRMSLIECKLLDGDFKGETVWLSEMHAARMTAKDTIETRWMLVPRRDKGGRGWASWGGKSGNATILLRCALNLEKSNKKDIALKYYKQIIEEYSGTSQAETAAERIKALEPK